MAGQTLIFVCKLLIYISSVRHRDLCKAVDRGMTITDVKLLEKQGASQGVLWLAESAAQAACACGNAAW